MDHIKMTKSISWLSVGMVVGALLAAPVGNAMTSHDSQPAAPRLRFLSVNDPNAPLMQFVHDPTSGGCWLASLENRIRPGGRDDYHFEALAPAPAAACK
ncbi:MAG: hypothetical protein AAB403_01265 [Planctomycetota bacterium]